MTARYRIVHFSQDFARGKRQLGGFSRIHALTGDGHAHTVFTIEERAGEIEEFRVGHLEVVAVPVARAPRSRRAQLALVGSVADAIAGYLRARALVPDVVFGHSQLFNYFVLRRVRARLAPRPALLWEVNAMWGFGTTTGVRHRIAQDLNRLLFRIALRGADAVVCQTRRAADLLVAELGLREQKVEVITNAIDSRALPPPRPRAAHAPVRVACIGLFDELNGIPFLADALGRAPFPGVEVVFVGDGKYRARVEALARAGRCVYLGTLPHGEMRRALPDFDALVIPRVRRFEADMFIPTKLVEAMAYGVVPICADVRAMADVVAHGVDGLLFAAGDEAALRDALAHFVRLSPAARASLGEAARAKVIATYDWHALHARLDQLYARAIGIRTATDRRSR